MTIFDNFRYPLTSENFDELISTIPEEVYQYWIETPTGTAEENIKELNILLLHYQTDKCVITNK